MWALISWFENQYAVYLLLACVKHVILSNKLWVFVKIINSSK